MENACHLSLFQKLHDIRKQIFWSFKIFFIILYVFHFYACILLFYIYFFYLKKISSKLYEKNLECIFFIIITKLFSSGEKTNCQMRLKAVVVKLAMNGGKFYFFYVIRHNYLIRSKKHLLIRKACLIFVVCYLFTYLLFNQCLLLLYINLNHPPIFPQFTVPRLSHHNCGNPTGLLGIIIIS